MRAFGEILHFVQDDTLIPVILSGAKNLSCLCDSFCIGGFMLLISFSG